MRSRDDFTVGMSSDWFGSNWMTCFQMACTESPLSDAADASRRRIRPYFITLPVGDGMAAAP